jgi:hypothetical protein
MTDTTDSRVVGRVSFVDGVTRDVHEDANGRQSVTGYDGERVYGVWLVPPEPATRREAQAATSLASRTGEDFDAALARVRDDGVQRYQRQPPRRTWTRARRGRSRPSPPGTSWTSTTPCVSSRGPRKHGAEHADAGATFHRAGADGIPMKEALLRVLAERAAQTPNRYA